MPVLLAVSGPGAGTRFVFDRETIVGRASECHLRVRDGRSSRRHARFDPVDGKVIVEDLGSRNGTFVNARKISQKEVLEPGDRVRIGETVLVFEPNVDFLPARHTGGAVVLDDAAPESRHREEIPGLAEEALQQDSSVIDPGNLGVGLAGRLAAQWDASGVISAGLMEAVAGLRADRGAVILAESGDRNVAAGSLVGGEEVVVDRALVRRVLERSDSLLFESDARELFLGLDQPISTGARVVIAVPIAGATSPMGVLLLERRKNTDLEHPWGKEALAAARVAGAMMGTVLQRVAAARKTASENDFVLRGGSPGEPLLVGDGPRLRELLDQSRSVARGEKPVLIVGEPGSGRALIARYIHEHSLRTEGPLCLLQCGRSLELDMESLLAGEERDPELGAGRTGVIESAHGGAIYLEDVDLLDEESLLLLRTVRRTGMVVRVGGGRPVPVDVRLLASTTTSTGRSRAGALLGMGAVVVRVPPLRERVEDISLLFSHFAQISAEALSTEAPLGLSPQGRRAAESYEWPGNVRELRNLVERLTMLLPAGTAVGPAHIPRRGGAVSVSAMEGTLAEQVALLEEALISRVFEEEGKKVEVAKRLGISRPTLDRKMEIYGIRRGGRRG